MNDGKKNQLTDHALQSKESAIARNHVVQSYNGFLQKSFIAAGAVGALVMMSNIPITFGLRSEEIRPFLDANYLTDTVRYISNHVRNGGQAMFYTQIANVALNEVLNQRNEDKSHKETGMRTLAPVKDRSLMLGSLVVAGNTAFEGTFGAMNGSSGVFDTHDVLWVGLGAAALTLWNKTSEMIARHKFPEAKAAQPVTATLTEASTPSPGPQ